MNRQPEKVDGYSLATILVANGIPLYGVLFANWDAAAVIVLYIFETIIIGVFHAFRLLFLSHKGTHPEKLKMGSIPLTLFFLFHYNFFIFVQSILLFGFIGDKIEGATDGFDIIHNFSLFLKKPYLVSIYAFIGSQIVFTGREVLVTHAYKNMGADRYMFLPYTRIFIQQIVVIIGAFIFMISGSVTSIVVLLILFKTTAEYLGLKFGEAWLEPQTKN